MGTCKLLKYRPKPEVLDSMNYFGRQSLLTDNPFFLSCGYGHAIIELSTLIQLGKAPTIVIGVQSLLCLPDDLRHLRPDRFIKPVWSGPKLSGKLSLTKIFRMT